MSDQPIALIPTDHEQSLPTFHVQRELAADFLSFLQSREINVFEPEEDLGELGSSQSDIIQIEVDDAHDLGDLENLKDDFLRQRT